MEKQKKGFISNASEIQIKKKVDDLLKDFTQGDEKDLVSGIWGNFHKFTIEGDYDKDRLIRYLCEKFLKFKVWAQPMEKINWEIPFEYKGCIGSFAHQKFGFRVYIDGKLDVDKAQGLFEEINNKVNRCLTIIEPLVRQAGMKALENGGVIVENNLSEIEDEFIFFFRESIRKEKRSNVPRTISLSSKRISPNFRLFRESQYLSNAAYISFFSLLEHLCILGLAFTDSPEKFHLEPFSRKTWQEKFKVVFPINNSDFQDYYAKFINLAKYRRNPSAHGHLDKKYTIFHFYLPEAHHRIPMGLYDGRLSYQFREPDNLALLKSFLKFIRENKETKRWMKYLDRGFDVYYEADSLKEYKHFINSTEEGAKEYLDYQSRMEDDMGNMDW